MSHRFARVSEFRSPVRKSLAKASLIAARGRRAGEMRVSVRRGRGRSFTSYQVVNDLTVGNGSARGGEPSGKESRSIGLSYRIDNSADLSSLDSCRAKKPTDHYGMRVRSSVSLLEFPPRKAIARHPSVNRRQIATVETRGSSKPSPRAASLLATRRTLYR